ncbi:hypothetical protein BLOT_013514 [Blomia tropicalis]|nr:hypothetical protein BLOT_013514 [Blomia tropicalis]
MMITNFSSSHDGEDQCDDQVKFRCDLNQNILISAHQRLEQCLCGGGEEGGGGQGGEEKNNHCTT